MVFKKLAIPDVILVTPKKFSDDRGFFMETFRSNAFCEFVGRDVEFVQENHSLSISANTVRGLHFQSPPFAQGKLVRCTQGAVVDAAVDARIGSSTYGQHVTAELSAENGCQLWIPEGFLHGFSTLEASSEIEYKCTNYYSAENDGNVLWNDPELDIDWGIDAGRAVLSDKDIAAPLFSTFKSPFQM